MSGTLFESDSTSFGVQASFDGYLVDN